MINFPLSAFLLMNIIDLNVRLPHLVSLGPAGLTSDSLYLAISTQGLLLFLLDFTELLCHAAPPLTTISRCGACNQGGASITAGMPGA